MCPHLTGDSDGREFVALSRELGTAARLYYHYLYNLNYGLENITFKTRSSYNGSVSSYVRLTVLHTTTLLADIDIINCCSIGT